MSNNKESFFRVIDKIDHCKDVICAKEEDVNKAMKKYRSMIHNSTEAYTEKAVNLYIFSVVQVFSEELDVIHKDIALINFQIDAINEELKNISEDTDNQEV